MNAPRSEKFRDPALADFGLAAGGRGMRLERLGGVLVARPLPQASLPPRHPALWDRATAVFRVARPEDDVTPPSGSWHLAGPVPDPWLVELPLGPAILRLEVRPAPSGQVGVFLEQVEQWRWLAQATRPGTRMLSLFAHSGAATLAMAAAGAQVVHVDASRQAIALARRNAAASGLADLPVRWVCEDAATFVARELRRAARYSGAVLDPPSWGHGPRGQSFAIDRDLEPLVHDVARLLDPPFGPLLVTSHSPGWHHRRLCATLVDACRGAGLPPEGIDGGRLSCIDDDGRRLDLGDFTRRDPASPRPCP